MLPQHASAWRQILRSLGLCQLRGLDRYEGGDVLGLLCDVGVPGPLEDLEVGEEVPAQTTLWQHALDRLLHDPLRDALQQASRFAHSLPLRFLYLFALRDQDKILDIGWRFLWCQHVPCQLSKGESGL